MNEKIGYMICESAVQVNEMDLVEHGNRVIAEGRLQTGNERNRNGRRYLTEDLAREINAPRQQELINAGYFRGEAGHPLSTELIRQQTIDPSNVCVQYTKLWMSGDDVLATFKGTNNDLGDMFDKDLRDGCKPAFSLRALGTVAATREGATVQNLKIITYDHVIYPSHPGAYTKGIVSESAELAPQSRFALTESMDATKSFIQSFTNKDVIDAMKKQQQLAQNEAAIEFIKDKSYNYHLLKECFDMTHIDTVDMIGNNKLILTEAGNQTFVMNIEDYVAKEIQNYKG